MHRYSGKACAQQRSDAGASGIAWIAEADTELKITPDLMIIQEWNGNGLGNLQRTKGQASIGGHVIDACYRATVGC